MTELNKKQIRYPVQQHVDKEPTQTKIQYGEFVFNLKHKVWIQIFSLVHDSASRCAKTNSGSVDLRCL